MLPAPVISTVVYSGTRTTCENCAGKPFTIGTLTVKLVAASALTRASSHRPTDAADRSIAVWSPDAGAGA